jgi:K+-sensing histidine kinase KdpD
LAESRCNDARSRPLHGKRRDEGGDDQALRKKRTQAYGLAVLAVVLTILLRLAVGWYVSDSVTFTTFFIAIIIAAFVGGFWPGMVAVVLSAVSGWYLFLPPAFSFALGQPEAFALLLFVVVATIAVAFVSGLVGSILIHEERRLQVS